MKPTSAKICALLLCCLCAVFPALGENAIKQGGPSPFAPDAPLLEVFFINVGQGDAIFLRLGGQTLLVDAGYPDQIRPLKDFLLRENGSLKLGSLLYTHQHEDHLGGQILLIKHGASAVHAYGSLPPSATDPLALPLFPLLARRGVPYARLASGDLLSLGGAADNQGAVPLAREDLLPQGSALIRVLCWPSATDVNASSLVLHLRYGLRSLLLTADITGAAQRALVNAAGNLLPADIVKAPHHGLTLFQAAFVDAVDPALVIVTNDPATTPSMGRQLEHRGLPALYSRQGTIRLATDGAQWHVTQDEAGAGK